MENRKSNPLGPRVRAPYLRIGQKYWLREPIKCLVYGCKVEGEISIWHPWTQNTIIVQMDCGLHKVKRSAIHRVGEQIEEGAVKATNKA